MPNQETNVRTLKINRLTDAQYDAAIKNDAELYLTPGDDTLSRNIGETIFSLIPLTDAGLHLLDGSLINGSGIYNQFVTYMADLYTYCSEREYIVNMKKVGSISDTDGIYSGFLNNANYVLFPKIIPFDKANNYSIVLKINVETPSSYNVIIGNSTDLASGGGMCLRTNNNTRLYLWGTTNGTSWTTSQFDTGIDLTSGWQYIKIEYTGSSYIISKSTDGSTWTNGNTCTTTKFTSNIPWFGATGSASSYYLRGSIDFGESYIDINNFRWWSGKEKPCFTDESSWQSSINIYGTCGKFVYDSVNNTIRLPKITGIVEGTLDVNALGDLVEAGLPDHKHNTVINNDMTTSGATYDKLIPGQSGASRGTATFLSTNVVDNPIYGNSTTVQPQTIKGYYYIVLATTVKTDIQVDIDEIATDLNNKANKDLSNATVPHITETYVNGTSWYRVYSDGWCEQGGLASAIASGGNILVNLLKPYINTNYSLLITSNSAYYAQAEANSTALKESENQIRITNGSHIASNYTWCTYGYIS